MNVITEVLTNFRRLGFQCVAKTADELAIVIKRAPLLFSVPVLKDTRAGLICMRVSLTAVERKVTSNHGVLFTALRQKEAEEDVDVYIKFSAQENVNMLTEGMLQMAAYTVLCHYGFPYSVPNVLDILKHPQFGYCMTQQRNPQAQLFTEYLQNTLEWGAPSATNDILVLSVIVQLATYLQLLEFELGMNHRDLTGTNVLMIVPNQQVTNTVMIDAFTWTFDAPHQAVLIDFGFACVGRQDGTLLLSAGQLLPEIDFCPKKGRDLFLFFASLWNLASFRESLTPVTHQLFNAWLVEDSSPTAWAEWLTHEDPDNMKSMYLFTHKHHFKSSPSACLAVIQDIADTYPEIVNFKIVQRPSTPVPE
jgi:hypothetical protein